LPKSWLPSVYTTDANNDDDQQHVGRTSRWVVLSKVVPNIDSKCQILAANGSIHSDKNQYCLGNLVNYTCLNMQ